MGETVLVAEGGHPQIGIPKGFNEATAATYLVCRLFTDAVFNGDVYAIQTIVNRIDGTPPADVDVDDYRTLFGDCIQEVLDSSEADKLKVYPEDTVMMALCKSLYDTAVRDIYHDAKGKPVRPSSEAKRERDSAMRLILERAGGRRTRTGSVKERLEVEVAPWIGQLESGDSSCNSSPDLVE